MTVAVRKLDRGLPRIDVLSPALIAKQRGEPIPAPGQRVAPETVERSLKAARRLLDEARRDREEAASVLAEARTHAATIVAEAVVTARAKIDVGPALPSVAEIIKATAMRHRITVGALLGRGRTRPVVAARHEAITLAHAARPDFSMPALGRIFRRDHTAILHALRKAKGGRP